MKYNTPTPEGLKSLAETINNFSYQPVISIVMPVYNTPEAFLREAIQSVLDQVYPYWELCIADDASTAPHIQAILEEYQGKDSRIKVVFRSQNGHISATSNSALELATGEFIGLLDHDDVLTPDALYEVVSLLNQNSAADMIYSDEDKLNDKGELTGHFFKPDWCPDSFLSRMYTCHFGVYRREIINQIGGFRIGYEGSQDYDLVLRLTEKTDQIVHIPKILYHWRIHSSSAAGGTEAKPYAYEAAKRALQDAIDRRGEPGIVKDVPEYLGRYWVRYQILDYKRVSIIIPTRDLGKVLNRCLESIFTKTLYPNYEVILIDNGSIEPETQEIIDDWQQKEPQRFKSYQLDIPFNFSQIINYGVQQASGDYLLLLNNDTEVITPDWIDGMVEQAQRPSIGAVGVLLQYPEGQIQHAGIIIGMGRVAAHSHQHYLETDPGYQGQIICMNNYLAVTAACLMCRREVFDRVNGLDEKLAVAYNDVDFCLKLIQQGYYNIYLPHVKLYHHESKSRGLVENTPEKLARFMNESTIIRERWKAFIQHDPCYNPNLTLARSDYSLRQFNEVEVLKFVSHENHTISFIDFALDHPQPGFIRGSELCLSGWILGKRSSVIALQILDEWGIVLMVIPVKFPSSDIHQIYPQQTGSDCCRFEDYVEFNILANHAKLKLKAIFQNGASAVLGELHFKSPN